MRGVFQLEGWLADLNGDLDPHPYSLFEALRRFYIDVCIYREIRPTAAEVPYDHLDLAGCFGQLAAAIDPLLAPSARPRHAGSLRGIRTRRRNASSPACPERRAEARYMSSFLCKKPPPDSRPDLTKYKLASPRRLAVVHQRSLRGVRIAAVDNPPFHHDFSSDVAFYSLELEDEWDHAVGERAIALYDRPALKGLRLFVYWR